MLNYNSSFDPYAMDSLGRRINKFEWEVNRKLFRTESQSWRMGLSLKLPFDKPVKEKESTAGTHRNCRM